MVRIVVLVTIVPERGEPDELTFLVERYLPVGDLEGLAAAVDRVASACVGGDQRVRYLQSTFVPGDDTCFCVFQGPSVEAVRAVNEAGRFTVDRISAAIHLPLNHPSSSKESR